MASNGALSGQPSEPSAILTFRDEYPDLLRGNEKDRAISLAQFVFTIDGQVLAYFALRIVRVVE